SVRTDPTFDGLLGIPRKNILVRARELSGRREDVEDHSDPFAGLSWDRPALALSALTLAGEKPADSEWAWRTFLNVQSRRNREGKGKVNPTSRERKFSRLVAGRLSQLPQSLLLRILHQVSDWLQTAAERFPVEVQQFEALWSKVFAAM